jgi:hypothetical protein
MQGIMQPWGAMITMRPAMSLWTDTETRELINLWPTASAAQIARRLHRPRYAVTAKATRLIRDGALRDVAKHFQVNPWPNRARPVHRTMPAKPTPPPVNNTLEPRPCTLIELDDGRCHWPLGDIEAVAVLFCGGVAVPGRCYCAHHLWIARGQGSASKRSVLSSHHAA